MEIRGFDMSSEAVIMRFNKINKVNMLKYQHI